MSGVRRLSISGTYMKFSKAETLTGVSVASLIYEPWRRRAPDPKHEEKNCVNTNRRPHLRWPASQLRSKLLA